MLWSFCAECVEFLSQRKSGAVLVESRHGEGQTDKHGLYQRKRSDRVLTTYIRYVLGWATSEEFWEGVKHGLVYELLVRVLQLSFGPFVVFKKMFRAAREERVAITKPREDKGGHKCFCRVNFPPYFHASDLPASCPCEWPSSLFTCKWPSCLISMRVTFLPYVNVSDLHLYFHVRDLALFSCKWPMF